MIGKSGIHAIRALVTLSGLGGGQHLGAAQIAEKIGARPNYLGKLLRMMARQGLVESQKGPTGGFRLARSPNHIRLLDVVEPIEYIGRWNDCALGLPECSDSAPCTVHERWKPIRENFLKMLADTTIADVARRSPTSTAADG